MDAFYELDQKGYDITHKNIAHILNLHRSTVSEYMNKNKIFYQNFIKLKIGQNRLKKYILTEQGKNHIELIYYFKNYYKYL